MSLFTYIASDVPLPVVENPHERLLSVNEALALGLDDIPENLLADGVDCDEPDTILWSDRIVRVDTTLNVYEDGDLPDDFALLPLDDRIAVYSEKKYAVYLEWPRFQTARAEGVIAYLRRAVQASHEVEVWHLWDGDEEKPIVRTKTVTAEELTAELLRDYTERHGLEDVYGIPEQYRLVIKG